MYCSEYIDFTCFDGTCPVALYHEYGADFGFELITCDECVHHSGSCADCAYCFYVTCPLSYLLAEAEPVW